MAFAEPTTPCVDFRAQGSRTIIIPRDVAAVVANSDGIVSVLEWLRFIERGADSAAC